MRRRQFIRFVGGAMAAWPLAARYQEPRGQTRLIGVVVPFSKTDSEVRPLLAAFNQRFRELGWTEGHNVRLEYDSLREIQSNSAPLLQSWLGSRRTSFSPMGLRQ